MFPLFKAFTEFRPNYRNLSPEVFAVELTAFVRKYQDASLHRLHYGPIRDIGESFVVANLVMDLPDEAITADLLELVRVSLGPEFQVLVARSKPEVCARLLFGG